MAGVATGELASRRKARVDRAAWHGTGENGCPADLTWRSTARPAHFANAHSDRFDGVAEGVDTKGETPLHRAAAFGNEEDIRLLLAAGARIDAKDANGDTPLAWASWYLRPGAVLHLLCYGDFRIHPERQKQTT